MSRRPVHTDDLAQIVSGDALHMGVLGDHEHAEIMSVARQMSRQQLTVTTEAVRHVLAALLRKEIAPSQAQAWASFVKRGYLPTKDSTPIQPIDFDYQADREDDLLEVIVRLDELGDLIDGTIDDNELMDLIHRLSD